MRPEAKKVGLGAAIGFLACSMVYGGLVAPRVLGILPMSPDDYMGLSLIGALFGMPWSFLMPDRVNFLFYAACVGVNGAILGTIAGALYSGSTTRE